MGDILRSRAFFERLEIGSVDFQALDKYWDRNIHQTLAWVKFVAEIRNAEPVISVLRQGDDILGYFTGLLVKKFGFKILGSPFPGWSTTYMGFNLESGVSRATAIEALTRHAFEDLKCHHLELMDRLLVPEDYGKLGFETWMFDGYELDLTKTEEELFSNMKFPARKAVRKARKSGVVVEESHDVEFADEFYAQLKHVFALNGSIPPYGVHRVRKLIELLLPTGNLLLLRARNKEGICIATGIYAGMNRTAFHWGAASWRHLVSVRPNEAIMWYTIRYWKARGMATLDLGGSGSYKEKYGPNKISVPWIHRSKNRAVRFLRNNAEWAVRRGQELIGKFARLQERRKGPA